MASKVKHESLNGDESDQSKSARTAAAEEALRARLSRKRTKTGCLTCRKRRIKCGEEHPVCRNCVKSRRHCEGYNQRVTFKQPFYDFRPGPNGAAHITFQAGIVPGPATPYYTGAAQTPTGYALHSHHQPPLQPRPVEQFVPFADQVHPQVARPPPPISLPAEHFEQHYTQYAAPLQSAPAPMQPNMAVQQPQMPDSFVWQQPYEVSTTVQYEVVNNGHYAVAGAIEGRPMYETPQQFDVTRISTPYEHAIAPHSLPVQLPSSRVQEMQWIQEDPAGGRRTQINSAESLGQHAHIPQTSGDLYETFQQPLAQPEYAPQSELRKPVHTQPAVNGFHDVQPQWHIPGPSFAPPIDHITPEYYEYEVNAQHDSCHTDVLNLAATEVHDDDYYDVNSDEEMGDDNDNALTMIEDGPQQALGRILQENNITVRDMQTRRYDTFLCEGILDIYRVDEHANPLQNPATARVFAHFIAVTGPSLSIFERHPRNTSVLFSSGQVPFSQQGIWTYTMPLAALRNQGLLHAMLALASLHIARLTGASVTPSMQHYAWALKRIHHSVGYKKKRLNVTTIAATMLLGFYEIMTADHMKWNMHLAGAKQLFVETDFVGMMQQFRQMRTDAAVKDRMGGRRPSVPHCHVSAEDRLRQIPEVDERTISNIVGKEVRYGHHGQVVTPQYSIPQELDLGKFEVLKDLYWWYCKQDAYQSIISGNQLLMDYSRWADCPPRAPLGKPDAVYGSYDHLILLLGRVADFAARDRARKLKQMELTGGQWRPAPGMQMSRPPQQPPPTPSSASSGGPMNGHPLSQPLPLAPGNGQPPPATQMPAFFGMAPPLNPNVQMPSAYHPIHCIPTPLSAASHDPIDLQFSTEAAISEWARIRAALLDFSTRLGDAFKPLTDEYQPTLHTAFGNAIFYHSFDIGVLWAIYNMVMIITLRSHPHMPPAAHMAAGVASQQTLFYADQIGRIVAGIVPGPPDHPLNPGLGAALCETCMPSFFAAVQYSNPHQRHETVMRIYSIAQRTGWGTAELIASGCETAWVKSAAAGRGPPYARVVRSQHSSDPRLNGSWEHLDPNSRPDETDETDRRHVRAKPQARLNWAIGIMGTEEDECIK
ncbi:hypothetical protein LTR87_007817 [Friedmanniomyces endolithicus]|nr:hypothetical protein LTR87_007817 [Friedmanniomyces endolithicus]